MVLIGNEIDKILDESRHCCNIFWVVAYIIGQGLRGKIISIHP
jgi:hypothetical protein